ncbi:MAG: hypothetical protein F6J87_12090 [Spirulina sp. SIO3F2]|nr:hypothetical protein [Spirulina sp. SIO3F2]
MISAIDSIPATDEYWHPHLLEFKFNIFTELAQKALQNNDVKIFDFLHRRAQEIVAELRMSGSFNSEQWTAKVIFVNLSKGGWAIAQAQHLQSQGEINESAEILEQAWSELPNLNKTDISETQINLINASLELGAIEQAVIWFTSLQDKPLSQDACWTEETSLNQAQKNRITQCQQAYPIKRQISYFEQLSDSVQKSSLFYNSLEILLNDLEQLEYQDQLDQRQTVRERIGIQFIRLGDIERGLALIKEHSKEGINNEVIEALLGQQKYRIVHLLISSSDSFDLENQQRLLLSLLQNLAASDPCKNAV